MEQGQEKTARPDKLPPVLGKLGDLYKYRSKGVKEKMLVSGLFLLGREVWEEHAGCLYLEDGQITY